MFSPNKKLFSFAVTFLSIFGYGFVVFAAQLPNGTLPPTGGYAAGDSILDPGCAPNSANCYANNNIYVGQEISGANPGQMLYTDATGNLVGDDDFFRDPGTKETYILAGNAGLNFDTTGTQLGYINNSIGPIARYVARATGNTITWDADTTDDIQDTITQSQNILGFGIKGNSIEHIDAFTGENASLVVGDFTGVGQEAFKVLLGYSNFTGGTLLHSFEASSSSARLNHFDTINHQRGLFDLSATGNLQTWQADYTTDIIDVIEQSQDIGGFGIKGTGVSHMDTNTGESSYSVWGDQTSVGGRPFTASLGYNNSGNTLNHYFEASDQGAVMDHRDSVANTLGFVTTFPGGNIMAWDGDTTDLITASINQGENLFGFGLKGNALFYGDSANPTNGSVNLVVGDISGAGLIGIQGTVLNSSGHSIGFDMNINDGFFGSYVGTNLQAELRLQNAGNSMIWDADTADTITTSLTQSENVLGFGVTGTWNAWQDTSTNIASAVGAGDLTTFGQGPGSTAMISLNTVTNDRAVITTQYNSGGTTFGAGNKIVNGTVENNFYQDKLGNSLVWDADTTDTIITKLEQSQDILGLGFFSGSALTWQDSATDLVTFNGLGDASGLGFEPSTSIMATIDTVTSDYATITSTYDTVTSSMLASVSTQTGAVQANLSLSNIDTILNYRTGGIGQEAMFNANAASIYMVYQATSGSAPYRASVGDGTFTFFNATTNDKYLSLNSVTGFYGIGDLDSSLNSTKVTVDDATQAITFGYGGSSYTFPIGDGTANFVLATDGAGQMYWADAAVLASDASLKSNIQPLAYGLDTLMRLNPVSYILNSTGDQQIGFIAQEVEPIIPELVGGVADGKKGLRYGQLTSVIVKSVQELGLNVATIENFAMSENNTFKDMLIGWLGNQLNGLTAIHVDQELCIGNTCINESDLQSFKAWQTGQNPAPSPSPAPNPIPDEVPEPDSSPEITDPVPDPAPTLDPLPEVVPTEN